MFIMPNLLTSSRVFISGAFGVISEFWRNTHTHTHTRTVRQRCLSQLTAVSSDSALVIKHSAKQPISNGSSGRSGDTHTHTHTHTHMQIRSDRQNEVRHKGALKHRRQDWTSCWVPQSPWSAYTHTHTHTPSLFGNMIPISNYHIN